VKCLSQMDKYCFVHVCSTTEKKLVMHDDKRLPALSSHLVVNLLLGSYGKPVVTCDSFRKVLIILNLPHTSKLQTDAF
jgi:hypothetical protein